MQSGVPEIWTCEVVSGSKEKEDGALWRLVVLWGILLRYRNLAKHDAGATVPPSPRCHSLLRSILGIDNAVCRVPPVD